MPSPVGQVIYKDTAKLCDEHARARKFGVITIQGPQHRTGTRAVPHWYPIPLPLHYKAASKHGMVLGSGKTRMMSSQGITFAAGDELKPGMGAQIALAWPFLLDGRVPLQLVLDTTITGRQDGVAEAQILAYDFRTAGRAEALGC